MKRLLSALLISAFAASAALAQVNVVPQVGLSTLHLLLGLHWPRPSGLCHRHPMHRGLFVPRRSGSIDPYWWHSRYPRHPPAQRSSPSHRRHWRHSCNHHRQPRCRYPDRLSRYGTESQHRIHCHANLLHGSAHHQRHRSGLHRLLDHDPGRHLCRNYSSHDRL